MQSFLSNLTAALLALHTVLGCCWHHAHACTRQCGATPSVESPDCREGRRADDCSAGCLGNHEHHGRHDCQGSTCVFLGPTKSGPHAFTLRFVLPPVAGALCDSPTAHAAGQWPLPATDALLPRLRLHLVHHVLLL